MRQTCHLASACPSGLHYAAADGSCVTPIVITAQPAASTTAARGSIVVLSVAATGNGTRQYLWRHDGAPIAAGQPHGATLAFGPVLASDDGTAITCDVSNGPTNATTAPAALAVPPHAPTFFDALTRQPIAPVLLEQTGSTVILTWASAQQNRGGIITAVNVM